MTTRTELLKDFGFVNCRAHVILFTVVSDPDLICFVNPEPDPGGKNEPKKKKEKSIFPLFKRFSLASQFLLVLEGLHGGLWRNMLKFYIYILFFK
jgi:hypothetical protein